MHCTRCTHPTTTTSVPRSARLAAALLTLCTCGLAFPFLLWVMFQERQPRCTQCGRYVMQLHGLEEA